MTHAVSPIVKYILHVQIVIHGKTANQTVATTTPRIVNISANNDCFARCRSRMRGGSRAGMSMAYTARK